METSIQREERVFSAALELTDAAERTAFLDRACDGDAQLRAAVEESIEACGEAEQFFTQTSTSLIASGEVTPLGSVLEELEADAVGTSVGPYTLVERLGEGGCGVVYLAEQEKPVRRRVALKIIKLGMDTKSVVARFEAERQALALMDHPNIARVLDAGATETGRPFFVMEWVQGAKITEYCDQNELNVRQRLRLFGEVCNAIQHAHQKGIIHRDIKPSNILVTIIDGRPVPKVIDFGIAKAIEGRLTDDTIFTAREHFIGTPAYMSPEQAVMGGVDVDTRTDIYSLGVLLYELLTGRTPFEQKELVGVGLEEMRRILKEREPTPPSRKVAGLNASELDETAGHRRVEPARLESLLRGDLDWIVIRTLEKDRARRYETASGVALDVQRFLDNEPIIARPPSRLYRLQKLVRRNKVTFLAGTMAALALLIALGVSTWFWYQEREARKLAVAAEHQALAAEQEQRRLRMEAEDRERITQAAILINQDRIEAADVLVSEVSAVKPSLETESVLRTLGEWHALKGQWAQAQERFRLLLEADQQDNSWAITEDLLKAGPILIERGDLKGYERFRRAAVARYADTANPIFAERTLKISLLTPADEPLMRSLEPLADIASETLQGPQDPNNVMAAWRSVSLALMAYRQNFTPTAKVWCQRCLSFANSNRARIATAHIIQAMACYQLDETEAAHSELTKGRDLVTAQFEKGLELGDGAVGFWFDWLFARILLREAETLIEGNSPADL